MERSKFAGLLYVYAENALCLSPPLDVIHRILLTMLRAHGALKLDADDVWEGLRVGLVFDSVVAEFVA